MALIAMALCLSTPPTLTADLACASPAATENVNTLQDAPAQVCSILPAASQNGEARLETGLAGPQTMDPAPDAAPTTPVSVSEYEFIPWQVHQKAPGNSEYRWP
jgi:hypothetical protein